MDAYNVLIEGYKDFRAQYLGEQFQEYRTWAAEHQEPRVMIIGCSDSRVNPAILTHAGLGEIFSVNNIANIVPPYEAGTVEHRSVGAALQYAVEHLQVEHIIIMGHSGCGGIKALMTPQLPSQNTDDNDFITSWVNILAPARETVHKHMAEKSFEEQCQVCEMEGILASMENLHSYPFITKAIEENRLQLQAWYFHLHEGELYKFDQNSNKYAPLVK